MRRKKRYSATIQLVLGIILGMIGIPSPKWIMGILCAKMLCSASPFQEYCWSCGLISTVFMIAGFFLIYRALREWKLI